MFERHTKLRGTFKRNQVEWFKKKLKIIRIKESVRITPYKNDSGRIIANNSMATKFFYVIPSQR